MSAIVATHLTKQFNGLAAVDGLDLYIEPGTLYGFVGPNGAGKTTTLRLLAALLEPTAGAIRLAGEDIVQRPEAARWLVGYMPDFFGVYDDMLVWEYLDFFARCYDLPAARREKLVDELLALVNLGTKRNAYVQTLSRGMRQRLCLAHALVHDPTILLLDEPASGLDPRARVEIRELLRELQRMGKTIIISSHVLSELAEMCDQIGIIERGRLLVSGPLDEVRRRLQHERRIRVTVISDVSEAHAVLAGYTGVGRVFQIGESRLEALFVGNAEATSDLLSHLVEHGLKIVEFTEDITNLEEVFLQLTKGETQ